MGWGGGDRMDLQEDYSEGSRTTTMYGLQAGFVRGTHDILSHPFIRLAVMERQKWPRPESGRFGFIRTEPDQDRE